MLFAVSYVLEAKVASQGEEEPRRKVGIVDLYEISSFIGQYHSK